jgi:hypothetical protein
MNEDTGSPADLQATVPLRASRGARIDLMRVSDALTNVEWLGPTVARSTDRGVLRRVRADLELRITALPLFVDSTISDDPTPRSAVNHPSTLSATSLETTSRARTRARECPHTEREDDVATALPGGVFR